MSGPILLDTDVLVDFLRGNDKAVAYVELHADDIILSAITAAELYAGVKGDAELEKLDALLSVFEVVPVDAALARSGGLHKRDYGASHRVGLADGIIAATAESRGAALKTLNTRHYPMLKGLKPTYARS